MSFLHVSGLRLLHRLLRGIAARTLSPLAAFWGISTLPRLLVRSLLLWRVPSPSRLAASFPPACACVCVPLSIFFSSSAYPGTAVPSQFLDHFFERAKTEMLRLRDISISPFLLSNWGLGEDSNLQWLQGVGCTPCFTPPLLKGNKRDKLKRDKRSQIRCFFADFCCFYIFAFPGKSRILDMIAARSCPSRPTMLTFTHYSFVRSGFLFQPHFSVR